MPKLLKPKNEKKKIEVANDFSYLDEIFNGMKDVYTFDEKEELTVMPTYIPAFNRAVIIGGYPMGTIGEAHGPNAGGKTAFGVITGISFIKRGHIFVFIDAERTANDKKWIANLGLEPYMKVCQYINPKSMEHAWDKVTEIIEKFNEAKAKKKIPKDKLLYILVDSVTKLIPEEALKKGGHGSFYGKQANILSQWLKILTNQICPTVKEVSDKAILFINQERKNVGAKPFEPKFVTTCGEALKFDSTFRIRISHAGKIKEGDLNVGKKHKFVIEKNKVGFPDSVGYFFTSNGLGDAPPGHDLARDILTEGLLTEVIKKSGRTFKSDFFDEVTNERKVLKVIRNDEVLMKKLMDELYKVGLSKGKITIANNNDDEEDDEDEDE